MERLQKKREVADRSGAMRAQTSRQASSIRISAARTGRTSSSPSRETRRVQTKVTASSPPTTATTSGRARASRSRPPGWRAATARKAPSAKPSSRKGVRVYGGPPAQPHERSGQAGQHRAQRGRQAHRDERPRPARQHEDHQRPEEVEVLLDGERPEVVEVGEGPLPVLGDVDVDGVEPRPCLAVYQVVQRRPPQQRDQRRHEEDERQHAIVEREDAEEAPHVEVAEVVRLVVGVVEDASDQEAGQDEEQLNAVGPIVGHADDGAFDPVARRHIGRRSGAAGPSGWPGPAPRPAPAGVHAGWAPAGAGCGRELRWLEARLHL